jgi:hypothetical protein
LFSTMSCDESVPCSMRPVPNVGEVKGDLRARRSLSANRIDVPIVLTNAICQSRHRCVSKEARAYHVDHWTIDRMTEETKIGVTRDEHCLYFFFDRREETKNKTKHRIRRKAWRGGLGRGLART